MCTSTRQVAILVLALLFGMTVAPAAEFLGKLTSPQPGPIGVPPDFQASYVFSWSQLIDAAEADVNVKTTGDTILMEVKGRSMGWARSLWQIDATHRAHINARTFRPEYFWQYEIYGNRTITTDVRFRSDQVWRRRVVSIDQKPAKWKRLEASGIFDILGALLFVRSQPLADGNEIRLVAYPGDAPFLAEIRVSGRETIEVLGQSRKAIRLSLALQKVEVDDNKMKRLVPHKKFKDGTVWVSDDELRIPLRAEVSVFIGYIRGDLRSFSIGTNEQ